MDSIDELNEGKKKINEDKTFTVPFDLEEVKENFTFKINTSSKLPKEQIINQAFKFHSQGKISEAVKYYQNFIDQGFKDPEVFSNYGSLLHGLGKLKEAEIFTRKAIEYNPDFAEAYSTLGLILRDLGKLKDAELAQRKAIKINPDFPEANLNLANILRNLGKLKEAEMALIKTLEIKPDYAIAHLNYGGLLQDLGKFRDAELSTRKAIELNPNFAMSYSNLGLILRDLGKLQEAEIELRKSIKIDPNFSNAHSNLGLILIDLGKLQEAEIEFRKALNLNPELLDAKINLDSITNKNVPKWHIPMMNDNSRNNAYLKAIRMAIKNNEFVLEIGTGSGLLSMMAIDAGAEKVITCETSKPIAEIAKKIIKKNGYSNKINVINKKSTNLNVIKDLGKKADIIISEVLSSEFVGEGVQQTLSDANQRLIKKDGRMIPESGEIRIALLESSPEIEKEIFVQKVNGYDLSEFNNIMGKKFSLHYLGRKTKTSFLSEVKVPFSFDFYSKDIIYRKEKILEIESTRSGICLGLITWLKLNLYENINFENKPNEKSTSGWVHPIYKFNQPLKISKGQLIKVKAILMKDKVWYEFI